MAKAKLTKRAEILDTLHALVDKQADLAQTNVSGTPGKDTEFQSISDDTETTDKNNVGPDKLNDEQGYKQKPQEDKNTPVANPKSASADIDKFATELLDSIKSKLGEAQTNISGTPGKDTEIQSVSDSTETTNKNDVGPDKLNDEQGYKQKAQEDKNTPVANAKSAEEVEAQKQASYDLGKAFCEALLKKAEEIKLAQEKATEAEMFKEAGRRDLDTIIAQAAAELEVQEKNAQAEKWAQEQGEAAFDALLKQAQYEAVVEENQALREKLAAYEQLEKEAAAKAEASRKEADYAKLAEVVADAIERKLSSIPAAK